MHWAQRLKTIICCLPSFIDLLPGTQHPQLRLPSCWTVNRTVQREVQDQASSARSPPFMFLLLRKRSCSGFPVCVDVGPQWVERGCALLLRPQPRRAVQVSARLLAPAGEAPVLGLEILLSAAVVLSRSLWRLINDVIQTRQIRALRRKIVKRVLLHPAWGQGKAGRAGLWKPIPCFL